MTEILRYYSRSPLFLLGAQRDLAERAASDLAHQNRLGIFLKLLRNQFMLRELDLIQSFVRHGRSSA